MTEGKVSSESAPSHVDDVPASVASPPLPAFLLDDDDYDDDTRTINTINAHHYARAKSLYHQRRGDNETL